MPNFTPIDQGCQIFSKLVYSSGRQLFVRHDQDDLPRLDANLHSEAVHYTRLQHRNKVIHAN